MFRKRYVLSLILALSWFFIPGKDSYSRELKLLSSKEIVSDKTMLNYDCRLIDDTLHLAIGDGFTINYYKAAVDSLFKNISIIRRNSLYNIHSIFRLTSDLKIFLEETFCFTLTDLATQNVTIVYDSRTTSKDKALNYLGPQDIYSGENRKYFVCTNFSTNLFTLFAATVQYSKNILIVINDNQVSQPKLIQRGRRDCSDFKALLLDDTLYAVWRAIKARRPGWLGWDFQLTIEYSKYDGERWSNPIEVVSEKELGWQGPTPLLGIYMVKGKFYVFWERLLYMNEESSYEVFYKWSSDGINWSNPILLSDDLIFISWQNASDGSLHILAQNENDKKKYYYIFDGKKWTNIGQVLGQKSSSEKILLDSKGNIHFFWETRNQEKISLHYAKFRIE